MTLPTYAARSEEIRDGARTIPSAAVIAAIMIRSDGLGDADVNDDGAVTLADPIALLGHLFVGGIPCPSPTTALASIRRRMDWVARTSRWASESPRLEAVEIHSQGAKPPHCSASLVGSPPHPSNGSGRPGLPANR